MKNKYEIGDPVWIYMAFHDGELTKGKVVHAFSLPSWCIPEHYVIEIETEVDPVLEIREPNTMSEDGLGPIGMWRGLR